MYKIVGFKRSTGSFTDKKTGKEIEYDNLNIYCVCKLNSDNAVVGHSVDTLKIKWDSAPAITGLSPEKFSSMIGKEIGLEYTGGAYPRLECIHFLDKKD